MPCDDPEAKSWVRVLDRSTFHLAVADADAFSVRMTLNGKEAPYDPAQPCELRSPNRYTWWIDVRHGTVRPRIEARVMKPEGEAHGSPYCHRPEGGAGELSFVTLKARTR